MLQVVNFTVAAKQLGIHRRSLERLIEEGVGPAVIQLTPRRRIAADETPPFEITVLNSKRPLSKTIKLKMDGITLDKGRAHPMERGEALR
jgi:hypothetical protein